MVRLLPSVARVYNGPNMEGPRLLQGDYDLLAPDAKAKRFRRRSFEERYAIFESHLNMVMALRPDLVSDRHESYPPGSVRVLKLPRG